MKREEIKPGEVYGFRRAISGPYTRVRVTGPYQAKQTKWESDGFPIESAVPEERSPYLPTVATSRELHPLVDVEAYEEEVRQWEEMKRLRRLRWLPAVKVLHGWNLHFGPEDGTLVLTLESPEKADRLAALVREKDRADRLAAVVSTLDRSSVSTKTAEAIKRLHDGDCGAYVEEGEI